MAGTNDKILDTISNMTVMEVVDLISEMEEKFGVKAAAAAAAPAAAPAAGDSGAAAEEKSNFIRFFMGFNNFYTGIYFLSRSQSISFGN